MAVYIILSSLFVLGFTLIVWLALLFCEVFLGKEPQLLVNIVYWLHSILAIYVVIYLFLIIKQLLTL